MSNPCINRWGLNTFWHHNWYSDSRYNLNLRQDKLILELIQTYLTYGSQPTINLFWNPFWYKSKVSPNQPALVDYYRWLTLHSKTVNTTTTYRMRIPSEEIFQTRISVMKFNAWFIINFYWFQPDKDKNKRARRAKLFKHTIAPQLTNRSSSSTKKLITLLKLSQLDTSARSKPYEF